MSNTMTPEETALLNDQTIHGEGPARNVGPWVLADLTFTRRRLLGRAAAHLNRAGATDSEHLQAYIYVLAAPLDEVRLAVRDPDALEQCMDEFLGAVGLAVPVSMLEPARACFDHDMAAIEAATIDIEPRSGTEDKDAPPNS